ncbi:DEAD/DEAH box helicase family protein [Babesia bovis T2Bo]|uniref:RNA helicase n=1 Tax=Babesia bovis TaxID=5865 RepID=A7AR78_BABBO|nr:DEAD/DEAH box helicase family protein [Babesia bovis T2Bo]EDO07047.1 DEAD/DEAH box helicase family protein [Babesia bovis T2Bo]|eukprot:XP_001610615.1 DEAD box RNA helicase [Babesia bovis T2Bo]
MSDIFAKLSAFSGLSKSQVSQKKVEKATFDQETQITDSRGDELLTPGCIERFQDLSSRYPNASNIEWLLGAIRDRLQLEEPSPVQKSVIPLAMERKNVVAVAPTGSGKTLAYLIPLLMLHKKLGTIQSLILVPTVELVNQVKRELVYLIGNSEVSILPLEPGCTNFNAEICISTPGTLHSLMKKYKSILDSLECLVVDEADVLLEGGYAKQLDKILAKLIDKDITKLVFSSTMQPQVLELAATFMPDAVKVAVGQSTRVCKNVRQELVCVTNESGKIPTLRQLIRDGKIKLPCLVFLQSIDRVTQVYNQMKDDNLLVERLTGQMSPSERDELINRFRLSKIWVLLCTNILARGLDIRGIGSVVNFDMPLTEQEYINRIGRSGRGEASGSAVTLFTLKDVKIMRHVLEIMQKCNQPVPEYLLMSKSKQPDVKKPPKRQGGFTSTNQRKKRSRGNSNQQ